MFTKQLKNMMELARVITIGALNRNESRGSHYKPEFPDRNDTDFLKTTKAFWTKEGPRFEWGRCRYFHIQPVARDLWEIRRCFLCKSFYTAYQTTGQP